eukprot:6756385-Alexandrium_andersonii.AAC.1
MGRRKPLGLSRVLGVSGTLTAASNKEPPSTSSPVGVAPPSDPCRSADSSPSGQLVTASAPPTAL